MMSWLPVLLLVIATFIGLVLLLKRRSGWEAIAAALLLGLAGYATQGHPGMPGAPKPPQQEIAGNAAAIVETRQKLLADKDPQASSWQVIADALARNGRFADASTVLLGAVQKDPKNADAWLALANSLVGHAEGNLSPAAQLAYRRAAEADPSHPGPPFFMGLAMAQSGRFADARALWAELLARSPADAPWRADLEVRLAQLDAFIAQREKAGAAQ